VIAAPDFGPLDAPVDAGGGQRGRRSVDMAGERFRPLPGTEKEGRAIGAALAGAEMRMGGQATEAAVKAARAPRILHIATHGFFLPDPSDENPLLRAGLALQGANLRIGVGGEDGVLTALEASALDLQGTKLIVLSACDTGLGQASTGEGVFGLRRALAMAGAETQVMSLWRVDDDATSALMVSYYDELLAGCGRSEALRRAELRLLRAKETAHPYYWASFIASGADGPLVEDLPLGRVPPCQRGCACRSGDGDPGGGAAAIGLLGIGIALRRAKRRSIA
jgi:MYXO-CTERM domain-containing protein